MGIFDIFKRSPEPIQEVISESKDEGKIHLTDDYLARIRASIKGWGESVNDAENLYLSDSLRYRTLLGIFRNIELDPHVQAIREIIFNWITQSEFNIVNENGEVDDDRTKLFKMPWFFDFVRYAIDGDLYPFNLMQITSIENGVPKITDVNRFNVRPNQMYVSKSLWQDIRDYDLSKDPYRGWTMLIKSRNHLGKYNSIAKSFILKREVMQFWGVYNELFTTPYFIVKTNFNNDEHRANLIEWLQNRKHSGFAVVGNDDEIQATTNSGSGYDSYERFIDMCNKEISKALLGSTMVLEDGSSRSQAEVHESNTQKVIEGWKNWIAGIVYEVLIPTLSNLGIDIPTGYRLEWVKSDKMNVESWAKVISQLAPHFDIDMEDAQAKVNLNLGEKQQQGTPPQVENTLKDLINQYGKDNTAD